MYIIIRMKYYLICFIDHYKDDVISVKDSYKTKEDAFNSLERVALEYVKEFQGKQQADKCKTEKTPEQMLVDSTFKEGMYIRKLEDKIYLYEKVNVLIPSKFLWNSYELKVNKIGLFNVSEYNFDDSIFRCGCMLERAKSKPSVAKPVGEQLSFLDELKQLMNKDVKSNLTSNWKNSKKESAKLNRKPVKTQSMTDIVDEIITSMTPPTSSTVPPAPPAPNTTSWLQCTIEPDLNLGPIQPKLLKTMSLPIKFETGDKSQPEIVISSTAEKEVMDIY